MVAAGALEGSPSSAGLRARLLALVLLAVLPALALVGLTAVRDRNTLASQAEDNALRLARLSASRHEAAIEGARQLLTGIARAPELRGGDTVRCERFLRDLQTRFPNYTAFAVADAAGNLTCSGLALSEPVNVADRAYFRKAVATQAFAVGDFAIGRVTGLPTLGFAIPIVDAAGRSDSIAIATLSVRTFESFASDANLPAGSAILVVDGGGTILARSPDPLGLIGRRVPEAALVQAVLGGREGVVEVDGLDEVRRLYGFARLRESGSVTVAVGLPIERAFADTNRTFWLALGGLALVGVLAIGAAWFFGTLFVVRPIDRALRREREAVRRLEELDRMRSDFVSMVSHDLRNPLATIRGFGQLLRDRPDALPGDQRRQAYDAIVRQVDRMASLVENVLDASRLEADSFTFAFIAYDPKAVVGNAVDQIRAAWPSREVSVDAPGDMPPGRGDPDRVTQALLNVLSNAVTHSDPKPVVVRVRTGDATFRVDVSDQGPGIPEDAVATLFDRFSAPGGGVSRSDLGLYISRRIVEAHDGRISVASDRDGGTTFSIEIPLDPPRPPGRRAPAG